MHQPQQTLNVRFHQPCTSGDFRLRQKVCVDAEVDAQILLIMNRFARAVVELRAKARQNHPGRPQHPIAIILPQVPPTLQPERHVPSIVLLQDGKHVVCFEWPVHWPFQERWFNRVYCVDRQRGEWLLPLREGKQPQHGFEVSPDRIALPGLQPD